MNINSNNNLRHWLALNRLHGLTQADILRVDQCLENLSHPAKLRLAGFSENIIQQVRALDWQAIDAELTWAEAKNHHIITLCDEKYPEKLCAIDAPPLVLFVAGEVDLLSQPQLAIVGSRNPTPMGRETASQFAEYLAQHGLVITSGLALGIDAASHEGALMAGKTVAVLGTGIDYIYPARNQALAQKISERGALIAEFPLKTPPKRENFPRRNRIISGLSLGVLVVEAALQSGSLITARFAGLQNREVFAIPGSIHSPLSRGCHQLLRQGAKLVEKAEDILEELQIISPKGEKKLNKSRKNLDTPRLDDEYTALLSSIGFETASVDSMIARTGFKAAQVSSMLLLLELEGYIKSTSGGYCRVI